MPKKKLSLLEMEFKLISSKEQFDAIESTQDKNQPSVCQATNEQKIKNKKKDEFVIPRWGIVKNHLRVKNTHKKPKDRIQNYGYFRFLAKDSHLNSHIYQLTQEDYEFMINLANENRESLFKYNISLKPQCLIRMITLIREVLDSEKQEKKFVSFENFVHQVFWVGEEISGNKMILLLGLLRKMFLYWNSLDNQINNYPLVRRYEIDAKNYNLYIYDQPFKRRENQQKKPGFLQIQKLTGRKMQPQRYEQQKEIEQVRRLKKVCQKLKKEHKRKKNNFLSNLEEYVSFASDFGLELPSFIRTIQIAFKKDKKKRPIIQNDMFHFLYGKSANEVVKLTFNKFVDFRYFQYELLSLKYQKIREDIKYIKLTKISILNPLVFVRNNERKYLKQFQWKIDVLFKDQIAQDGDSECKESLPKQKVTCEKCRNYDLQTTVFDEVQWYSFKRKHPHSDEPLLQISKTYQEI